MTQLEEQIEHRGPTFDLNIMKKIETESALFIPAIIELRRKEIESLVLKVKLTGKIDTDALWNTYYGRMLIKTRDYTPELDLQEVITILGQLEKSGIPLEMKILDGEN